jgi:phosphoacetylglucosamine mutase
MKSILPTTPNSETVLSLLHAHPLPTHHDQSRYYAYGTAGFRYAAGLLPPIVVRVGLIMALLLKEQMTTIDGKERSNTTITSNSNSMGVMITASHNDESYNGLKISNPDGSMIGPVQEALLVQWVNESSVEAWKGLLLQGQEESKSASSPSSSTPLGALHVGRDTRSHSLPLSDLLIQAATAMGVTTICNHGILTTPMLHHIVLYSNNSENKALASREAYLNHLANAYVALDQALTSTTSSSSTSSSSSSSKLPSSLQVDGACGVGYQATLDLQTKLAQLNPIYQNRFQARNPPTTDPSYLNDHCGSEHVQKQLQPPVWYDTNTVSKSIDYSYCCSVDGDADRIVFFASTTFADGNNTGNSTLLDGDKIAVLIATFIKQLMQRGDLPSNLTVGVVQTAYANGASTQYLQVSAAAGTVNECIVYYS